MKETNSVLFWTRATSSREKGGTPVSWYMCPWRPGISDKYLLPQIAVSVIYYCFLFVSLLFLFVLRQGLSRSCAGIGTAPAALALVWAQSVSGSNAFRASVSHTEPSPSFYVSISAHSFLTKAAKMFCCSVKWFSVL